MDLRGFGSTIFRSGENLACINKEIVGRWPNYSLPSIHNWRLHHRWLLEPAWCRQCFAMLCCAQYSSALMQHDGNCTCRICQQWHGLQLGSSVLTHSNGFHSFWYTVPSGTVYLRKNDQRRLLQHFVTHAHRHITQHILHSRQHRIVVGPGQAPLHEIAALLEGEGARSLKAISNAQQPHISTLCVC